MAGDTEIPASVDCDTVASTLKKLLRELPETLLTNHLFSSFTSDVPPDYQQLQQLCHSLPADNFEILAKLTDIMHAIVHNEDVTQMGYENLAMVIGPNLSRKDRLDFISMKALFRVLIEDKDFIFRVRILFMCWCWCWCWCWC